VTGGASSRITAIQSILGETRQQGTQEPFCFCGHSSLALGKILLMATFPIQYRYTTKGMMPVADLHHTRHRGFCLICLSDAIPFSVPAQTATVY
jgi:hypothetical protein